MMMDVLYIAVIVGVVTITPASHCNLIHEPVLTRRKMFAPKTGEDDKMGPGDDVEPNVCSMGPTLHPRTEWRRSKAG